MNVYRENDLRENHLKDRVVAVIGYGNQGHAHALNLRDSGVHVLVGARDGKSAWARATADGFTPLPVRDAVSRSDVVSILLPDEVQRDVFTHEIQPNLRPNATLLFAHGFTIAFRVVEPPHGHDVLLVAPKGQGHYVRALYREGQGLPCLVAVDADASGTALHTALSYASMIGCLRAGAIETTFREEAVTDLFGEQVVLCGGVPTLVTAAFDMLVENGYQPQIAYLECLHELKIITDLMHRRGVAEMRTMISKTAAWGSVTQGAEVISEEVRKRMRDILASIESGTFASGWLGEADGGQKHLNERLKAEAGHPIEKAGADVRKLMPYLTDDNT